MANREPIVVRKNGKRTVVQVQADELASLMETAHLLRSPKNTRRLLTALRRAKAVRDPDENPLPGRR
jgi:antitoxin YefM